MEFSGLRVLRPPALAKLWDLPVNRSKALMALDIGDTKVGVAVSDPTRAVALPLTRIDRRLPSHTEESIYDFSNKLNSLIERHNIFGLVVGWPVELLSGKPGPQCRKVYNHIERLYGVRQIPLTFWDERATTFEARDAFREAGMKKKRQRQLEDQVAASLILQSFLSSEVLPEFDPAARKGS